MSQSPRIEHLVEATPYLPDYSGLELTEEQIAAGEHRSYVGGVWDSHGKAQLEYLQSQGLRPTDRFLDVGCGSLRAGQHFVDFLEPGNYYGVDANRSVLQAGYDVELGDGQRARLPVSNLRANDRFNVDFGVQFDVALAQSVFTHVSLNHMRLCLHRVARVMRPGGVFYATAYVHRDRTPVDQIFGKKNPKPSFTEQNVFWYYRRDLRWVAERAPWTFEFIGDWGHPANQQMVRYTRISDEEFAERQERAKRRATRSPAGPAPAGAPAGQVRDGASGTAVGDRARALVRRGRRWAAARIDPR